VVAGAAQLSMMLRDVSALFVVCHHAPLPLPLHCPRTSPPTGPCRAAQPILRVGGNNHPSRCSPTSASAVPGAWLLQLQAAVRLQRVIFHNRRLAHRSAGACHEPTDRRCCSVIDER